MKKITDLPLSAYLRASTAHANLRERMDQEDLERGSSSTETTLIIAGLVLLAITVIALISKKVIDKADSISF